ncbi:hypothetical protein GGQ13_002607 [Salinibacter ruber]|nr:hypothetical protein [Salinibacter ruber]MCS4139155.1 hypothetical protein [Salinibacter ruber]
MEGPGWPLRAGIPGRQGVLDGVHQPVPSEGLADILVEPFLEKVVPVPRHGEGRDRNGRNVVDVFPAPDRVEELYPPVFLTEVDVQEEKIERVRREVVERLLHVRDDGNVVFALQRVLQKETGIRVVLDRQDPRGIGCAHEMTAAQPYEM